MAPTLTPDREAFRQAVADVAAKAKEKLPQAVNGRIEKAIALVLAGDVLPAEDGTISVASFSDPLRVYRLEGHACTCQDFLHGKAPEGWCCHRIAAGIDKRVREMLAALPAPASEASSQVPALPEAPASANMHVMIAGRQVQVTLRDTDEMRLMVRVEALLERYPQPEAPAQQQAQGWCQIHNCAMQLNQKNGRSWHSHRLPDGEWCKGK